jgi:glycosyltransferase involved in cell wall biosynthesis
LTVGVIVPVYAGPGGAPYLGEALDAVLAQEPPPDQVIVVDDGSPSPVRLDDAHTARARLVRRETRGGPGAARDVALALLETELIACADADDVWCEGKLAAQLRALERHPEGVLCFGTASIIDGRGRATAERWRTFPAGVLAPESLAPLLYASNVIPTSSVIVRRQALLAAGGFSGPPLCEDWSLWLRLLERGGSFVSEPGARVLYRRHAGGLTADVAALAESALAVHTALASLVDEGTRRQVRAADLSALARGRVRQRRWRDARLALREAATLAPPPVRDRALDVLLALPGARVFLGRRSPY